MVEKSGVEKFMVEKSGVEMSFNRRIGFKPSKWCQGTVNCVKIDSF